jgi:hypothetical protein
MYWNIRKLKVGDGAKRISRRKLLEAPRHEEVVEAPWSVR